MHERRRTPEDKHKLDREMTPDEERSSIAFFETLKESWGKGGNAEGVTLKRADNGDIFVKDSEGNLIFYERGKDLEKIKSHEWHLGSEAVVEEEKEILGRSLVELGLHLVEYYHLGNITLLHPEPPVLEIQDLDSDARFIITAHEEKDAAGRDVVRYEVRNEKGDIVHYKV